MNLYRVAFHIVRLPLYLLFLACGASLLIFFGALVHDLWVGDAWLYVRIVGVAIGVLAIMGLWFLLMDWLQGKANTYRGPSE